MTNNQTLHIPTAHL